MYQVSDNQLIGKPETPRKVAVYFNLLVDSQPIKIKKEVIHRYSKRDKGELYEPFEILPIVTTKLKEKVVLFSDLKERLISVEVRSGASNVRGKLSLKVPKKWQVSPGFIDVDIKQKGDVQNF